VEHVDCKSSEGSNVVVSHMTDMLHHPVAVKAILLPGLVGILNAIQ